MISREKGNAICVFLLLYYIYMNSVRKLMIPMSSITVPAMLMMVLAFTLMQSKGKIRTFGQADKIFCLSWILIAVYIMINNEAIFSNIISGGIIQLFVMISVALFMIGEIQWEHTWIKFTKLFVAMHAVATVIFFFNGSLYSRFVSFFFGSSYAALMRYYNRGWMSGLTSHFSSNGMLLSVGLLFYFESIRKKRDDGERGRQYWIECVTALIVLYALILSSKRGPLLAAVFAIIFTYILGKRKNVVKRLLILIVAFVLMYLLYNFLLQKIPGLGTIMAKFNALEESDAGLLNGRSGLWERAIELFKSNPFFGGGYGSYATYASATDSITTSAHNYYLQVLAELGVVGLVLYIFAFASGIISALDLLKKGEKHLISRESTMVVCIALAIQVYVIIYSITSTSMMYYPILVQYFFACAVVRNERYSIKRAAMGKEIIK